MKNLRSRIESTTPLVRMGEVVQVTGLVIESVGPNVSLGDICEIRSPRLKGLQADFVLQAESEAEGLQWLRASPKAKEGQIQSVRAAFRRTNTGPVLAQMEVLDSFGQRSVLTFTGYETNPVWATDHFQFKPPAGADVVRP